MSTLRYGLYPGTFDPIHIAHLALARRALADLTLAGVTFLPAGTPPNKPGARITSGPRRLAMIRLAIAGVRGLSVSDAEIGRAGPSYLVDTLEHIATHGLGFIPPGARVVLIGGSDLARDLPNWRAPTRILELAELAWFERPGEPLDEASLLGALGASAGRLSRLPAFGLDLRASSIRADIARGLPVIGKLPPGVEAYIRANGLYRA